MAVKAEFHFDFGSPNAYLAHRVLPAIESRTGIQFDYVPVLIGGVFKATNNLSPMEAFRSVRNKNEYNALETRRFMAKHGITNFRNNPYFPVNTLQIMRGAIYAQQQGVGKDYINLMFRGMWEEELNLAEEAVVRALLVNYKLPADSIMTGLTTTEVKQRLIINTTGSVERGNFGSPTFFIGTEMFFGKDRLLEVEEEIHRQN